MPRVNPASRAIANYRKMKVKTTSLPCRVMEAQRLIEIVRIAGSRIQQWRVRKLLNKAPLEIVCRCHDDNCPFLESDSDGTRYCTCVDWEAHPRENPLGCKTLEVIGHQGNKVFKIGEGFVQTESHEPVFDSTAFEDYLNEWHSINDSETRR